jgi:hypothetical protein
LMSPARRRSKFLSTTLLKLTSVHALRQLSDDFDLHEKPRIDQTLHLHP